MDYFSNDFSKYKDFLQGDIFRVNNKAGSVFKDNEKYAFLITADCDLANPSRNVEYLTFLPIISTTSYLESIWIPLFFEKIRNDISKSLHKLILSSGVHHIYSCEELNEREIKEWLKESSYESILNDLNITNRQSSIINDIQIDKLTRDKENISNFIKIKKIRGASDKNIIGEIKEAINNPKEEFFIVPMLDSLFDECGVVKLRMIRPVHKSNVYKHEIDARLSNSSDIASLVRIGRFSDYLRYSVSQNFATLFSRIGMPGSYESDRDESIILLMDRIKGEIDE